MIKPNFRIISQVRSISYKQVKSWYAGLVKTKPPEAPFNHVIQIGDPTLRTASQEIPRDLIQSPEVQFLINRMKNVMKNYNCVGLAAPQVGVAFRLFLMEFNERHLKQYNVQERKVKEIQLIPFKVVINPEIKVTDFTKVTFTESCESVRGFHAEVPRFRALTLTGYDQENQPFELEAKGWLSRIIQHEMDHLNGKIYTDIMKRETLACSCWQVINDRGGKVELPYGAQ